VEAADTGVGFFASCSVELRSELQETRARLLIARNRRQLAAEEAAIAAEQGVCTEGLSSGVESCGGERGLGLRQSSEEKWRAENALAKLKAEQQLELLKARDIPNEVRAQRVRTQKSLERDMVAIEKLHGALASSDNVPRDGGFAETVVSGAPGCSISPSSSVSEAEVRALHRERDDYKSKLDEAIVALVRCGIDPKDFSKKKGLWTVGDDGEPVESDLLDEAFVAGYSQLPDYGDTGKVMIVPLPDIGDY
jgi:hypothetical protein